MNNYDWVADAACHNLDPRLFFLERQQRDSHAALAAAKAVCHSCPVREDCLVTAIKNREQYGIFGGLTVSERRRWAKSHPIRLRTCLECDTEFEPPIKPGSPITCCSEACATTRRARQQAEYVQRRKIGVAS